MSYVNYQEGKIFKKIEMNMNNYLLQYGEPNPQVNEPEKTSLPSYRNTGRREDEALVIEEKVALSARVQSLKKTVLALKTELQEEKTLWKKEVDFITSIIASSERGLESELNSEAELDAKSVMSVPISPTDPLVTSPLIRDYEEKLNRYQGALAQAQAEKRFNIRRQIAANTYRKRLNEVEKLCQEELDKVRETATYLEPLKQIASEWNRANPKSHYMESMKSNITEKTRKRSSSSVECGGDFLPPSGKETQTQEDADGNYEVPVKQIDASLVMDEDASSEIKGKIVLQIGSLPSEVPTICYSAKFE